GCARGLAPRWSGKERPAEVIGGVPDAGQREEVAAAERADVVDQRLADEPGLHGLELALDVLLVAREDQAHVEVAGLVDAAAVVVAGAGGAGWPAACAPSAGSPRRRGLARSPGWRTRCSRPAAPRSRGAARSCSP